MLILILYTYVQGCKKLAVSLLLMIYADDWKSIFGDPTKFLFGLMTVIFHLILLLQHLLYRSNNKSIDDEESVKVSSDKHTVGIKLENKLDEKITALWLVIVYD